MGQLPYGEIPANKKNMDFNRLSYIPCRNHNDDIPSWLDGTLRKSVHADPSKRYHELSEFLYDLRNPNNQLATEDYRPLLESNPLRFWQGLSAVLALAVLGLLVALSS